MSRSYRQALLGSLIFIYSTVSPAAEQTCLEISRSKVLCDFLTTVTTYQGQFSQELIDEQGELQEESEGELWLKKPGLFRWDYATPWERVIVSDGKTLWLYDAELEQVTMRNADSSIEQTPAGLLAGNVAALSDYSVTTVSQGATKSEITLVPAVDKGDFREVILSFTGNELSELNLSDRFGQRTVIRLHKMKRNEPIPAEVFSFEIPAGADVINQSAD